MAKIIHFPRWAEVLSTSDLGPSDRKAYQISIRWYLSWCCHRSVGCSAESALEFVEWAQREKKAEQWAEDRWKEALRWFFVTAKAQREGSMAGGGSGESGGSLSDENVRDSARFNRFTKSYKGLVWCSFAMSLFRRGPVKSPSLDRR